MPSCGSSSTTRLPFVSGRLLSARWDDPATLRSCPPAADASLYRLRRIDGAMFERDHGREPERCASWSPALPGSSAPTSATRLLADGHEVLGIDNLSTGRRRVPGRGRTARRGSSSSSSTCSTSPRPRGDRGGTRRRRPPGGQRRRAVRVGRATPGPRAERHRDAQRARGGPARRASVGSSSPRRVRCTARRRSSRRRRTARSPCRRRCTARRSWRPRRTSRPTPRAPGCSTTVFRFVSNLGPRYTHGHVIDFVRKLRADPTRLTILGDGTQRKSYLDVTDCVAAHRLAARSGARARGVQPRRRRLLHGGRARSGGSASASAVSRSSSTPAATAGGSATTRSSTSTRQDPGHRLEAALRHPRGRRAHRRLPRGQPVAVRRRAPARHDRHRGGGDRLRADRHPTGRSARALRRARRGRLRHRRRGSGRGPQACSVAVR